MQLPAVPKGHQWESKVISELRASYFIFKNDYKNFEITCISALSK